jgi:hypothetical protein
MIPFIFLQFIIAIHVALYQTRSEGRGEGVLGLVTKNSPRETVGNTYITINFFLLFL